MLEHLTKAMFFASWTSILWAPLVAGIAVWTPRYRWSAALGITTTMIALFCAIAAFRTFQPDCEILQGQEVFLCRERGIARAMLDITMIGASLIASIILLIGWLISRKRETRKVAH